MKTIDEYADELYARAGSAESYALVLLRCLDYDRDLILDAEAYRVEARKILDASERVLVRHLADRHLAEWRQRIPDPPAGTGDEVTVHQFGGADRRIEACQEPHWSHCPANAGGQCTCRRYGIPPSGDGR